MKAGRRAVDDSGRTDTLFNSLSRGYKQRMHASEKKRADFSIGCAHWVPGVSILQTPTLSRGIGLSPPGLRGACEGYRVARSPRQRGRSAVGSPDGGTVAGLSIGTTESSDLWVNVACCRHPTLFT
jgi:hypothetical protein